MVCRFDEFHFGKFINMYLKQVFFFDIHPPLGKLLLAGAGYMADTNVTFPFERIGDGKRIMLLRVRFNYPNQKHV